MKPKIVIGILVITIICLIIIAIAFSMSNSGNPIMYVKQINGGIVDKNDSETWLSRKHTVYSNYDVKMEESYGGGKKETSNYKISEQNYNDLMVLLEDRNNPVNAGQSTVISNSSPKLRMLNSADEQKSIDISVDYFNKIIGLIYDEK